MGIPEAFVVAHTPSTKVYGALPACFVIEWILCIGNLDADLQSHWPVHLPLQPPLVSKRCSHHGDERQTIQSAGSILSLVMRPSLVIEVTPWSNAGLNWEHAPDS